MVLEGLRGLREIRAEDGLRVSASWGIARGASGMYTCELALQAAEDTVDAEYGIQDQVIFPLATADVFASAKKRKNIVIVKITVKN